MHTCAITHTHTDRQEVEHEDRSYVSVSEGGMHSRLAINEPIFIFVSDSLPVDRLHALFNCNTRYRGGDFTH